MNGNVLKELVVKIGYDVDSQGEKKIEKQADSMADRFEALSEKINLAKESLIALVGVAGISKLVGLVTSAADKFEALGHEAAHIGAQSAEDLGALQYAFAQMGIEADDVNNSLKQMTDIIGQAKMGEGEGVEVFKKLGITITDAKGRARNTIDIFYDLVDKFQKLDHATKVAYINMLGLDTELVEGMSAGRKSLKELENGYRDTYKSAGLSVDEAVKKATEFNGVIMEIKLIFKSIKEAIGAKFLATGVQTFTQLKKIITDNMQKVVIVLQKVVGFAMAIFRVFLALAKAIFNFASRVMDWWNQTSTLFRALVKGIGLATIAMLALNSAFLASPLGKLLAIITAIGLIVEDFQVWKEGGLSLTGDLIGSFDDVMKKIEGLRGSFGWFTDVIKWIVSNLDAVTVGASGFVLAFKPIVSVLGTVKGAMLGLIGVLGKALRFVPFLVAGIAKVTVALLTNPIGLIITAIGALIAIGVLLYQNWDTVSEHLQRAWNWVKAAFEKGVRKGKEFLETLGNIFDTAIDVITSPWKYFFQFVQDGIKTLSGKYKWFDTAWKAVSSKVSQSIKAFKIIFTPVVKGVVDAFEQMAHAINNIFEVLFGKIAEHFKSLTDMVGNAFGKIQKMWNGTTEFLGGAWKGAKEFLGIEENQQPQNSGTPAQSAANSAQGSTGAKGPLNTFQKGARDAIGIMVQKDEQARQQVEQGTMGPLKISSAGVNLTQNVTINAERASASEIATEINRLAGQGVHQAGTSLLDMWQTPQYKRGIA